MLVLLNQIPIVQVTVTVLPTTMGLVGSLTILIMNRETAEKQFVMK